MAPLPLDPLVRPAVMLVVPPLVETGFGQAYPSTAVLAAYLHRHGIDTEQVDLNSSFVDHLLDPGQLARSAAGAFTRSTVLARGAAQWARRRVEAGTLSGSDLVAASRGEVLHAVMRHLVEPYSVDPVRITVDGTTGDVELDASFDQFFSARIERFTGSGERPRLIGLSVPMGPQLLPALRLAALIQRANRSVAGSTRIVLGGPALSLLGEHEIGRLLRHNPAVDCIVRYDGEIPLLALVEQLGRGKWNPALVPGTAALSGHELEMPAAVAGPKLNSLPTPIYDLDPERCSPNLWLGVTQARGCYWGKCDYCDFVEVYGGSAPYRGRKPALVVDDIRRLHESTGVRNFRLITESIPPAFARRFSELLIEQGLGVRWSSFIMVDRRFDRDLLAAMAASGCDHMVVGMESMVSRVLELVHKSANREENIRFLRAAHRAGLRLYVNMIPDLPSTTHDEAMDGLTALASVAHCAAELNIIPFETTKSSRVGRSPEKFGLIAGGGGGDVRRHAQLAVNSKAVRDPAMSLSERDAVFAAYRALAAEVNRGATTLEPTRSLYEHCEIVETDDGPVWVDLQRDELRLLPTAAAKTKRSA